MNNKHAKRKKKFQIMEQYFLREEWKDVFDMEVEDRILTEEVSEKLWIPDLREEEASA